MKTSPFLYLAITTFLLIAITIICALDVTFTWAFYLTVIGQIFIMIMVYKVLTDNYSTDKTFAHLYEDRAIQPLEVYAENEKFR